jgi:peroxiredoxin
MTGEESMIHVGDQLPAATLRRMTADGIKEVAVADLTKGKKVVLFAVPGAFTPTCSEQHLPGFLESAAALKAKGIQTIACIAVNDPFVMGAWDKATGVDGRIELLSDGNAEFTKALGLEFDGGAVGLGTRSRRYAMVVDDGVVKTLLVEDAPGQAEKSSAQAVLATL